MKVTTEKVEFTGSQGFQLSAKLEMPDSNPVAYALYAPCFTCGKDIISAKRICQRLAQRGIATMRIDFAGIGASEGGFHETSFSTNVEDLKLAADYLTKTCRTPEILIGHSLGGTATLAAAGAIENSRCVVTIGSPFDPAHVVDHFLDEIPRLKKERVAEVKIMGRPFQVSYDFIVDIEEHSLMQARRINELNKPLLVMHSPLDDFVGIENAEKIFSHALHPKSYVSLDHADHLLIANEADAAYVSDIITHWAEYYIRAGVQKITL